MMADLTLYDYELDENCYRTKLLLAMLGLEWKTVSVNMFPTGEHLDPAMLAINPGGAMPVLADGDLTLAGATAILLHLSKAYNRDGTLLPSEPRAFGEVMKWIGFYETALPPAVELRLVSLFALPGDAEALKVKARRALRFMDDHMTARHIDGAEWFAGSVPTLADLFLFPTFALSHDYDIGHGEYPALRRWVRRFRTLPGFRTMPGIPDYY